MIDWSKLQTAEQLAAEQEAAEREQRNAEARAYLTSTDWYVIRQQETGVPVPPDITAQRKQARLHVA